MTAKNDCCVNNNNEDMEEGELNRKSKKTRRGRKKKALQGVVVGGGENNNSLLDPLGLQACLPSSSSSDAATFIGGGDEDLASSTTNPGDGWSVPADYDPTNNINNNDADKSTLTTKKVKVPKNNLNHGRLRPRDPKAPENSTQFIIDDHENSELYLSFEYSTGSAPGDAYHQGLLEQMKLRERFFCSSPWVGVNFEYESPDDVISTAYYEQDFEETYQQAKEDLLQGEPRQVIENQYNELEKRLIKLKKQISKMCPKIYIEKLQGELLTLQEEHARLQRKNGLLKSYYQESLGLCKALEGAYLDGDDNIERIDEDYIADRVVDEDVDEQIEEDDAVTLPDVELGVGHLLHNNMVDMVVCDDNQVTAQHI